MASEISTRFLILSDTHGEQLNSCPAEKFDVVIHCGDLTEESKLQEFNGALSLLKQIDAPLKLVIAGNHDFTLDASAFQRIADTFESSYREDKTILDKEFGVLGQARQIFEQKSAKDAGIKFLDEGVHEFSLANSACLKVYASPYTPSPNNMGFQYDPKRGEHDWNIDSSIDIVITHGPPHGILDLTSRVRAGSPSLFKAVALSKPRMHCFGHIHEAWGAKLVTWREDIGEYPTHFTAIDNNESIAIESLASIRPQKFDTPETSQQKQAKRDALDEQGSCRTNWPIKKGTQTLFVNAAIEGPEDRLQQWPFIVDIDLPKATRKRKSTDDRLED